MKFLPVVTEGKNSSLKRVDRCRVANSRGHTFQEPRFATEKKKSRCHSLVMRRSHNHYCILLRHACYASRCNAITAATTCLTGGNSFNKRVTRFSRQTTRDERCPPADVPPLCLREFHHSVFCQPTLGDTRSLL